MERTQPQARSVPHPRQGAAGRTSWLLSGIEAVVVVLAVLLLILVKRHLGPFPGDVEVTRDVQHSLLHSLVTGPIELVSSIAWPIPAAITVILILVVLAVARRWLDGLVMIPTAVATSLSNLFTADWVRRPRPTGHGVQVLEHVKHYFSFPSGHVVFATAIWGLVIFLTYQTRYWRSPWLWAPRALALVIIVLMPISRVLEGEHWPTDCLEGLFYGAFWLLLAVLVHGWAARRFPRLLSEDERLARRHDRAAQPAYLAGAQTGRAPSGAPASSASQRR